MSYYYNNQIYVYLIKTVLLFFNVLLKVLKLHLNYVNIVIFQRKIIAPNESSNANISMMTSSYESVIIGGDLYSHFNTKRGGGALTLYTLNYLI